LLPLQTCGQGEAAVLDGSGVCLFTKRLEEGKFRWPRIEDGVMRLSAAQLAALVEGLDWTRCTRAGSRLRKLCSSAVK